MQHAKPGETVVWRGKEYGVVMFSPSAREDPCTGHWIDGKPVIALFLADPGREAKETVTMNNKIQEYDIILHGGRLFNVQGFIDDIVIALPMQADCDGSVAAWTIPLSQCILVYKAIENMNEGNTHEQQHKDA